MARPHVRLYYPFIPSRAAPILWGRLLTCGRLLIGPPAAGAMPEECLHGLRAGAISTTNRMAAI